MRQLLRWYLGLVVTAAGPLQNARAQSGQLEPGHWFAVVYHDAMRRVLLVNGGPSRGGKSPAAPMEIWSWDGARWSLVAADTAGPRWRNYAVVSYDSQRNRLLLYGGLQYGTPFDDTWEWDGARWTKLAVAGPGPRYSAEAVYDKARRATILFGGSQGERVFGDMWSWDGRAWMNIPLQPGQSPSPRGSVALVFDDVRRTVLLYGGHFPSFTDGRNFGELWEWNGTRWRLIDQPSPNPGLRVNAHAVFDPGHGSVLMVAPAYEDATTTDYVWRWDGTRWSSLGDGGFGSRNAPGLAFDAARNRVVLFGGIPAPGANQLRDTWEFDGTHWQCVAACRSSRH